MPMTRRSSVTPEADADLGQEWAEIDQVEFETPDRLLEV